MRDVRAEQARLKVKRHPTIGNKFLLSAHVQVNWAKSLSVMILKIVFQPVVLKSIPAGVTASREPAEIVTDTQTKNKINDLWSFLK